MRTLQITLSFVLIAVFCLETALAQSDGDLTLRGRITNANTGDALAGTNIMLEGTPYGCASDRAGYFRLNLPNLPAGKYTLRVSYIGFHENKVPIEIPSSTHDFIEIKLEPSLLNIEEIVVTATRSERSIEGISASVTVIGADEIKKMGAATLRDVFEKTPELILQYGRFPHPSSKSKSSISVRGLGANGTLLLIDGKRLSGETERPYEMDRIPSEMIEKIEIVKGTMSTLYGSDAVGGVINLITKKPGDEIRGSVDIKGGMNQDGDRETLNTGINLRGKTGKLGYSIFGNFHSTKPYAESETYTSKVLNPKTNQPVVGDDQHLKTGVIDVTYRDDAQVSTIGGTLEYDLFSKLKLGVDISYFSEDREGIYRGASRKPRPGETPQAVIVVDSPVNSIDDNNRWDYSGDVEYRVSEDLITKFRLWRSDYKKRNRTTALNFTAPVNKKFSANVTFKGYEAFATYFLGDHHVLTGGAEYRAEERESSAINPDPTSTEFIKKTIDYASVYLQDEWQITKSLNAIMGARFDNISGDYDDNKVTLKAGLVKNFSPLFNLRLNYAEGYRTPDVAELFVVSPTPGDIPRIGAEAVFGPKQITHELKPEFTRSYEIGGSGRHKRFHYDLSLFFNDIEDKIDKVLGSNVGTFFVGGVRAAF
jgi:outer membrane receptor for ferrienterochelin and colicins